MNQKKKIYIMFCWSQSVGGGQNYVNTKVKYLENTGWIVQIFTIREHVDNEIIWENLKKYNNAISFELGYPPEFWTKKHVDRILDWMESFLDTDCENIIIESHTDIVSEWGELLAKKINAKHICFLLDERLEEYNAKRFLYFKFLRGEVAGIHLTSVPRLFKEIRKLPEDERYVLKASNSGSVQDIESEVVKKIPVCDWNIAYLGRDKAYVPVIIKGIYKFASEHLEKKILLIIFGSAGCVDKILKPANITIYKIDFMRPIPREFFSHIDVVIAGAGCADLSAREGTLTIVADPKTYLSNGVLGYDIRDALFSSTKGMPYEDILHKVLVDRKYKDKKINLSILEDYNEVYAKHFEFIERSEKGIDYYNFELNPQKLSLRRRLHISKSLVVYAIKYIKNIFKKIIG